MKDYGYLYHDEIQQATKRMYRVRAIIALVILIGVWGIFLLGGCSVTLNIAAEGQPCTLIVTDPESLKME